jgi:hypothetical protein
MPEAEAPSTNGRVPPATRADDALARPGALPLSSEDFAEQFGENILRTLDLGTWRLGSDLDHEYRRIEHEVREAERFETAQEKKTRDILLPRLATLEGMPKHAGLHNAALDDLVAVQNGLLFNGSVEACHGAVQVHDTLPLTIYQLGISLVSYRGDQGTWGQRLFRRDLRQKGVEIDELMDFLERRARRDASARPPGGDHLGELVQKAILEYGKRAILLHRSQSAWLMGQGNPVTYELLTGGSNLDLMVRATEVLRGLIEKRQKFVFVGSEPHDRLRITIGQALRPLEYAIIDTLDQQLDSWLHQERFKMGVSRELLWDDETLTPAQWIPRFIKQVASQVVVGVFRPTLLSPPRLFYAHVDHSQIAAHIALADSMLREQGTPLLLEMARHVCDSVFGDSLDALAESAYAAAGAHNRYFGGQSQRLR